MKVKKYYLLPSPANERGCGGHKPPPWPRQYPLPQRWSVRGHCAQQWPRVGLQGGSNFHEPYGKWAVQNVTKICTPGQPIAHRQVNFPEKFIPSPCNDWGHNVLNGMGDELDEQHDDVKMCEADGWQVQDEVWGYVCEDVWVVGVQMLNTWRCYARTTCIVRAYSKVSLSVLRASSRSLHLISVV